MGAEIKFSYYNLISYTLVQEKEGYYWREEKTLFTTMMVYHNEWFWYVNSPREKANYTYKYINYT